MRLVHYQYKPEFAATVGIENTAETGNNFTKIYINLSFKHLICLYSVSCYHLNVFIWYMSIVKYILHL